MFNLAAFSTFGNTTGWQT